MKAREDTMSKRVSVNIRLPGDLEQKLREEAVTLGLLYGDQGNLSAIVNLIAREYFREKRESL